MELLDYDAISLLSGIDESRQTMRIQAEKLVDFVYGNLMADERAKKNLLWLMVNDLLTTEQGLLDMHKEFLEAGNRQEAATLVASGGRVSPRASARAAAAPVAGPCASAAGAGGDGARLQVRLPPPPLPLPRLPASSGSRYMSMYGIGGTTPFRRA